MQKRSLRTYIEWSSEFPQLLSDQKNYDYPPNLKCIPNFGPLNSYPTKKRWLLLHLECSPNFGPLDSYPRRNDDYHLTGNAFRISEPSTLIRQKTMISASLRMPSEFRTSQLLSEKKKRWICYLTWKVFRISDPSTLIREKTMITT